MADWWSNDKAADDSESWWEADKAETQEEPKKPLPVGVKPSDAGAGRGGADFAATDPRRIVQRRGGSASETARPYGAGDERVVVPPEPTAGQLLERGGAGTEADLTQASKSPAALAREREAMRPQPSLQNWNPTQAERAAETVRNATGSQAMGVAAARAADTYMLAPEALATGAKLVSDIANLATLGGAQETSDWLGRVVKSVQAQKSPRYQEQQAQLGALLKSDQAGVLDVIEFLGSNPGFTAEIGIPSLPSVLIGAGAGRVGGALNAALTARRGGAAADVASAYRTGAVAGAGAGNVAMNAGATFSETDGDVIDKLLAAVPAAAGTALANRLPGAERVLAGAGGAGNRLVRGGVTAGAEGLQEGAESLSQSLGKGTVEGNFDLGQAAKQAVVEGAAGFGIGGVVGLASGAAPAPAPVYDAEALARSKGFLSNQPATTSFTPPDSEVARAGITPIVAPVAPGDAPQVAPVAGITPAVGSRPDFSRALAAVDERLQEPATPAQPAADAAPAAPAPGTPSATTPEQTQPQAVWTGRRGDGYVSEADAQQAQPGREKKQPELAWKVEARADGKFVLNGYARSITSETTDGQRPQPAAPLVERAGAAVPARQPDLVGDGSPVAGAPGQPGSSNEGGGGAGPALQRDLDQPGRSAGADALGGFAPPRIEDPVAERDLRFLEQTRKQRNNEEVVLKRLPDEKLQPEVRVFAAAFGRPVALIRDVTGRAGFGAVVMNKDRIYINAKAPDAALKLTVHEIIHTLPAGIRQALVTRAMTHTTPALKDKFLWKYEGYQDKAEAEQNEEMVAMFGQDDAKTPQFWESLREKVGDSDFGKLAKHILSVIDRLMAKVRPGDDRKFFTDIEAVRDLVTTALAKSSRGETFWADDLEVSGDGGVDVSEISAEDAGFSERPRDFADPESRQEVSTTQPSARKGGKLVNDAVTQKWVIDGDDIKSSDKHVAAVVKAIRKYNTVSGKGNAAAVMKELHDVVVDNLLWLHDLVPAAVRERAKLWYDGANVIASDWTKSYNISLRQAAGVLAALSPQMDWFKNVSLAERVLSIWRDRQAEAWSPAMTAWMQSWVNASKTVDEKTSRVAHFEKARGLEGKTLGEMNNAEAAYFIRAFDEAYYPRQYRLVTPEGGFGDLVTNAEDSDGDAAEAAVTWGGYSTIEKTVAILGNDSFRNISEQLGDEHKVRNFYDNIINPGSRDGHVTIDTHAVAAAWVKALSGASKEVADNMGGAGQTAATGASGSYALYADAYRDAAAQRGLLAREMQSITWEAVRALFPASDKKSKAPVIEAIWNRFKAGELTREQARAEVHKEAGGIRKMSWEGGDSGTRAADGATSFDMDLDSDPGKRQGRVLEAAEAKDKIVVSMSAATNAIAGIKSLYEAAGKGDAYAHGLLQDIAVDSLKHLLAGTSARVKAERATGLYGGASEPSVAATIVFTDEDRPHVLAALAKFADNFNQEQIHVRQGVKAKPGTAFKDGSYSTPVYKWDLKKTLTRKQIQAVIDKSGLYGLTFGDDFVEAYYVGDPKDEQARQEFGRGAERAGSLLGKGAVGTGRTTQRLWPYGQGDGVIGYDVIRGDVSAGQATSSATAKRVAEYLAGAGKPAKVKAFDAKDITPEQAALQQRIARVYESLPDNDLANARVARAYRELGKEVRRQYLALPVKVEVLAGQGEPYADSSAMRKDVADNNHLFVFGTDAETFGPAGSDFSGHPLLEDSGITDINGRSLLLNDLLRAVHDYYAHTMSPAQFGPKGEEAAWKNHMAMTTNPWARWALTSETRGQNSWVNFRPGAAGVAIKNRDFARQKAALLPLEFTMVNDRGVDKIMREFEAALPVSARQGSKPEREVGDDVQFSETAPLLAPNGRPSKLTPAQHAQVRTPAFRRWFGDWEAFATQQGGVWNDDNGVVSKAVDPDTGEPMVLYHGSTNAGFARFWETGGRQRGDLGIFLTNNKSMARSYVRRGRPQDVTRQMIDDVADDRIDPPGGVYGVFANVRAAGEEYFHGANWDGQTTGFDLFEVRTEDGDNDYAEDGRQYMSRDEAEALAESSGGTVEEAGGLPYTTDDVVKTARGDGMDGAILYDVRDDGGSGAYNDKPSTVVAVFDPRNVKSADFNEGSFDDGADIRYSESPWYSALSRALATGPNQAPPEQWRAFLKGLPSKGVKPDEIEWSGVEDWLKLQQGKVSRADVVAFVGGNGVKVEEVVLGGAKTVRQSGRRYEVVNADGSVDGRYEREDEARAVAESATTPTKFGSYTLPGGTNYREVLLTLPVAKQPPASPGRAATPTEIERGYAFDSERQRRYVVDGRVMERAPLPPVYKSNHWDTPNVLAHIRVNDRVDADGKRVLFVEELQSDWGAEGRKRGFKGKTQAEAKTFFGITDGDWSRMNDEQRESYRLEMVESKPRRGDIPSAPFVQKTDSWLGLALKRVITMAVHEGYDRVAFVTGEQAAERFDLSKTIARVNYEKVNDADRWEVDAYDHSGTRVFGEDEIDIDRIEAVLGKDVAKRIAAGEGRKKDPLQQVRDWRVLEGLDLKTGGEGMKGFYDVIVPAAARALLKKLGGQMAAVELPGKTPRDFLVISGVGYDIVIYDNDTGQWVAQLSPFRMVGDITKAAAFPSQASAQRALQGVRIPGLSQPGFDITPAMHEAAASGLPMFSDYETEKAAFGRNFLPNATPQKRLRASDLRVGSVKSDKAVDALTLAVDAEYPIVNAARRAGDSVGRAWRMAVEALPGRTADAVTQAQRNFVDPLTTAIAKASKTLKMDPAQLIDAYGIYRTALHAGERNATLRANGSKKANPSGMSEAEAAQWLAFFGGEPELLQSLQGLDPLLVAVQAETDRIKMAAGLLTQDDIDARSGWDHYISLRGDPGADDVGGVRGSGSWNNDVDPRARGRDSLSANPVVNTVKVLENSIRLAEMARVKAATYDFAMAHPDIIGAKVERLVNRPLFDANGNFAKAVPNREKFAADAIVYRQGDVEYHIEIGDGRVLESIKRLEKDTTSLLVRGIGKLTQGLGRLYTQFSPHFPFVNFIRDLQQQLAFVVGSSIKIQGKEISTVAAAFQIATRYPATFAAAVSEVWGAKPSGKYTRYARELVAGGGASGFTKMLSDDDALKDFVKDVKQKAGKANTSLLWDKFVDAVAGVSEVFELTTRVAAYSVMRDMGMDAKVATNFTKNLMNFSKAGVETKRLGHFFMFLKPAVQDVYLTSKLLRTKKGAIVFASMYVGALAMYAMLRELSGDDDEDPRLKKMDTRTAAERRSYYILPVGGEEPVRIPVGFGLPRMAWGLAVATVDSISNPDYDAKDAVDNAFKAMTSTLSPMQLSDINMFKDTSGFLLTTFAPTLLVPLAEHMGNKTKGGNTIYKDNKHYSAPDYSKGFSSTPKEWKDAAQWMYDSTNGTIDVAPETLSFTLRSYGGGPATLLLNALNTNEKVRQDEELGRRDIPIVQAFTGPRDRYPERRFRDLSKDADEITAKIKDSEVRGGKLADKIMSNKEMALKASLKKSVDRIEREEAKAMADIREIQLTDYNAGARELKKLERAMRAGKQDVLDGFNSGRSVD